MRISPVTRRHFALAVAALAAAGVVATAVVALNDHSSAGDGRAGSRTLPRSAPPIAWTDPPVAYAITYRVTDRTGTQWRTTTEVDRVRRPFDARREVHAGPSVKSPLDSTTISALGWQKTTSPRAADAVLQVPPGMPATDVRPDAVRDDAIDASYFDPAERREVLGRACQVYRTLQPAVAGALEPAERDGSVHSEICIDAEGLVLEEVTFRDGHLTHRRVATALDLSPHLTDADFATSGTPLTLQQGGGSVRPVAPDSRPPGPEFFELPAPPDGFTMVGRFAVIPPQPQAFTDPTLSDFRRAGVSDVYQRGADALIVERGGTVGGKPPFAPVPEAPTVDVGPALGQAAVILGLSGTELRVTFADGHYVRVIGTLPVARLTELARSLVLRPGGELVYLDR
ncbi:MAG TPA: hypothetical protein VHN98_12460 [Acidimicrobiales bacterium]|nr:hypothetical protein [Acidimicrobiales bacterium]